MMVLKHGILHLYPDTFDIKDLSCNNADSIITVIIVTLHNHQDLIVRPSISDTRNIYVCLHWFTYDYLLAHMQACVFIHYIHIALPTVRLPWPFCRKSTNCARFDHAKAPGSGKAQDGDLRGHNLFVGGKLELGSLFSFSATAGSSSCSCWFARAMHNWVSRTWMQLKLLARRCLFFPQS